MTVSKRDSDLPDHSTIQSPILDISAADTFDVDQINRSNAVTGCFHCYLPIPAGVQLTSRIDGEDRPVCCQGCKSVADAIVAAGHEHFYRVRTKPSTTGVELVPDFLREIRIYDDDSVQQEFVRVIDDTSREASLILEGINCAACVWLNEQHLAGLPGVIDVRVNYATRRAWVRWNNNRIRLSEILKAVGDIGYRAYPCNPEQQQALHQREKRIQIRRLAVAGLFGMQVMMISISLYSGAWTGMEYQFENLFRWLSLALTLPVLIFSSASFFRSAWFDLRNRRVGMDVPVSLGISIAFISSLIATVRGQGEIYFDSVVMFTFLLLVSRYFEWVARQRSSESVERLAHALPMTANLIDAQGEDSQVAASVLSSGDLIYIRPGEVIPADAVVTGGTSSIDESLLSGESRSIAKTAGDSLIGGSLNIESPLQARVISVGSETVLANIHRMIETAQSDKPPLARLADRVASRFIVTIICVAAIVSLFWWVRGNEQWLEITLSLLIVTCPCALSLATPAAISVGLSRMQRLGILIKKARAIEALNKVTHVVFDKTGTLTVANPVVQQQLYSDDAQKHRCLAIAASLEQQSEHPLARAIVEVASDVSLLPVTDLRNCPGGGISGLVDGKSYAIGSIDFIQDFGGCALPDLWREQCENDAATIVVLADRKKVLAVYILQDEIRDDAAAVVKKFKEMNLKTILMSGDDESVCSRVAAEIGIDEYFAELKPDQKMQRVKALQDQGGRVLMVGDGINDAPVLSVADVSIAVGGAAALAKTSADIVMLGERIGSLVEAVDFAARIQSVIRQNFFWAISYNICVIPAAAAGFISPWMAAIGMSLSSLVVVSNAMRLNLYSGAGA